MKDQHTSPEPPGQYHRTEEEVQLAVEVLLRALGTLSTPHWSCKIGSVRQDLGDALGILGYYDDE